jgi:hypothetical protein
MNTNPEKQSTPCGHDGPGLLDWLPASDRLPHCGSAGTAWPPNQEDFADRSDEAGKERAADRRLFVADHTVAVLHLNRARRGDAEQLPLLAFRLDQCHSDNQLTRLGAGVLAGETDVLPPGSLSLPQNFVQGE